MRHHTAIYGAGLLAAAADGFFGQRQAPIAMTGAPWRLVAGVA